ncbi:MAG TPA: tyrosine-type recombinase/integrase [Polyangiaceae bacterium]|jgi:integrase
MDDLSIYARSHPRFPRRSAIYVRRLLERRLAYGILVREGMRAGELQALRWRDLDLDHGRIRLDENKTDDSRDVEAKHPRTRIMISCSESRSRTARGGFARCALRSEQG